jgi:hypothetical protein
MTPFLPFTNVTVGRFTREAYLDPIKTYFDQREAEQVLGDARIKKRLPEPNKKHTLITTQAEQVVGDADFPTEIMRHARPSRGRRDKSIPVSSKRPLGAT